MLFVHILHYASTERKQWISKLNMNDVQNGGRNYEKYFDDDIIYDFRVESQGPEETIPSTSNPIPVVYLSN